MQPQAISVSAILFAMVLSATATAITALAPPNESDAWAAELVAPSSLPFFPPPPFPPPRLRYCQLPRGIKVTRESSVNRVEEKRKI